MKMKHSILTTLLSTAAFTGSAELFTTGSGDWFTDANWENDVGTNVHPNNSSDPLVRIRGSQVITLSAGTGTTTNELAVGHGTDGTLELGDPARLEPGQRLHIGANGAVGTVNMTGGTIDTPVVLIGRNIGSKGFLNMTTGVVSATTLGIGNSGGRGALLMSGGDIDVNALQISDVGFGIVTQSSGRITTTFSVAPFTDSFIGTSTASGSDILLSGDAAWSIDDDFNWLGGTLSMTNAATMGINGNLTIRNFQLSLAGASVLSTTSAVDFVGGNLARLTMDGGTLTTGDLLILGNDQDLKAEVTNAVFSVGRGLVFGNDSGSEMTSRFIGGAYDIRGDSAATDFRGDMVVGLLGDALVEFGGDAQITIPSRLQIGRGDFSDGALTLSGNTLLTAGSQVDVAVGGQGSLTLEGNAQLQTQANVVIGNVAGSDGAVDVGGGSMQLPVGGTLIVGLAGNGTAAIGPGFVSAGALVVGDLATGTGDLIVREGAQIELPGSLSVADGTGSIGVMTMTGGRIDLTGATSDLRIGTRGNGTATLGGTGVVAAVDDILIGPFNGANGTLLMISNAVASCNDDLKLASDGTSAFGGLIMGDNARLDVGDQMLVAVQTGGEGLIELDGNAVLDAADDIFLGDAANVTVGLRLGLRGGNPTLRTADLFQFPRSGADDSHIFLEMFSGLIEGRIVEIGSTLADNTTNTVDIVGGTIRSTVGGVFLEGEGGIFTMSGGTIEGAAGVLIADGVHSSAPFQMVQSGGTLTTPDDVEMFTSASANSSYRLVGDGQITPDLDFLLGEVSFDANSSFTQAGGTITVGARFHNRGGVAHLMTGGELAADTFDLDSASITRIATMIISGGVVNVDTAANVENAFFEIHGGEVNLPALNLGTRASSTSDLLLTNGTLQVAGPLAIGHPSGLHTRARLEQSGGVLVADGPILKRGEYDFTGGVLTRSSAGVIQHSGSMTITEKATLLLEQNKQIDITGALQPVDSDGPGNFKGAGVIDLSNLNLQQLNPVVQFHRLGSVTNPSSLTNNVALDEIEVVNLVGFNRVTEDDFQRGLFTGNAFALVEGETSDGDGIIGIKYKFSEPVTIPIANTDTLERLAGSGASIPVSVLLANDSAENGGVLIFTGAASLSDQLQNVSQDGTNVTYSPAAHFNDPDTFSYTINNGEASAIGTVQVLVFDPDGDEDSDGMSNRFELENFGGVTNGLPDVDSDLDLHTNLEEFIAGTLPNNSNSVLRIGLTVDTDGTAIVDLLSASGRVYQVCASTNLPDFVPVGLPVPGTGGEITMTNLFTDTEAFLKVQVMLDED